MRRCGYYPRRMRAYLILSIAALTLLVGNLAPACAQAPEGDYILLDNGHVLIGRLIDEGDNVLLRLGRGSQMRLPRGRIRGVGRNGHELFLLQRRQLHHSDVAGRIELARWCLRNDLTDDAGQLLVELTRLAPRDPQVAYLEQQLRRALQPPAPAIAKQPAQITPPAEERQDDIGETLTSGQITSFTSHVQPVLLNSCSAAGCHGVVSKSEFKILRPFSGHALTQRMTKQNMHAALAQVDRRGPSASKLLRAATEPHGGRDVPILAGPRAESSLSGLKQWVESLKTSDAPPKDVANVDVPQPTIMQRLTPPARLPNLEAESSSLNTQDDNAPRILRTPPPGVADPYDPGDFNRRFHPERFQQRSPFDEVPPPDSSSNVNSPADSASRNATLLDNNPGSAPISSGESQR